MPDKDCPVVVREASREDIPGIASACATSVSDEEVVGFGGPASDSPFTDATRLSSAWKDPNLVDSEFVFVADKDGLIIGVVTVEDRGKELELVNIDVRLSHQGQGVGTMLVEYMEQRARQEGRKAVTLGTSRNAEGIPWRSLPWWESRGYGMTHEEENAWTRSIGPGAREIRMRKDLAMDKMD